MQKKRSQTQRIALGLSSLCLITWLTGCSLMPELTTTYVSVPVTGNLELLCKPTVPRPKSRKMSSADLVEYVYDLQDSIKECAIQQNEYRAEIERLVKRAQSTNPKGKTQ